MTDTIVSSATREVVIGFDRPFVIIGERINPTGRKAFAQELRDGDLSTVRVDALAQTTAGADVLDINAGIPLYQSLVTLENQTKNPKLAEILRGCQQQVQKGGKLSDVFAAYPWIFSELQIEMIRAAEQGGMLDKMLLRIADYLEQEIADRVAAVESHHTNPCR